MFPPCCPSELGASLRTPVGAFKVRCCQREQYVQDLIKQMNDLNRFLSSVNPLQYPEPCRSQMESEIGRAQQHLHAAEMGLLANDTYSGDAMCTPDGWERVETVDCQTTDIDCEQCSKLFRNPWLWTDPESGFHAVLYKKGNMCVLAFKGTELMSRSDWRTNFRQAEGLPTDQYSGAMALARWVNKCRVLCGCTSLEFVGHSLGGGLAAAASAATGGLKATTFNAAGVNPETLNRPGYGKEEINAENYVVPYEPLTLLQENKGFAVALGVSLDSVGSAVDPLMGSGSLPRDIPVTALASSAPRAAGSEQQLPSAEGLEWGTLPLHGQLIPHQMGFVITGLRHRLESDQAKIASTKARCEKQRAILSEA